MSRKEINIICPSPARRFYLTELIYCFAALVTLLVNDAKSDQRNTTVAVLGKGSSFGVCTNFFSLFVLFSVIYEAYEGMWLAHRSFSQPSFFQSVLRLAMASRYCTLCDALWRLKNSAWSTPNDKGRRLLRKLLLAYIRSPVGC